MPDQAQPAQGGQGDSKYNFMNWLMGLLAGHPAGTQSPAAQSPDEKEAMGMPSAQPTPMQTPQVTPGMPQATPTPTNSEVLQRMGPQPTPGPPQAMAHPAMQLQMAKAGMPQPMEEEENKGPMKKPMMRRA